MKQDHTFLTMMATEPIICVLVGNFSNFLTAAASSLFPPMHPAAQQSQ